MDAEGNTIEKSIEEAFARLTDERFERIKEARNLFLQARFSTPEEGMRSVQIRADQNVRIGMGLKVGVTK